MVATGSIAQAADPRKAPQACRQPATDVTHIRTILVPTDFSPGAQRALEYAAAFAAQVHARIVLMHVVEPLGSPDLEYFPLVIEPEKLVALAHQQLSALPEKHDFDQTLFTQPLVRTGIAFYEITEAAREKEVDLIILSAHEFTGLKHVWLGSTAERVVRHASCPVLVLGKTDRFGASRSLSGSECSGDALRVRCIVAPVDFSDPSREALSFAGRIAQQFGASVHLLYVIESLRKLRHAHALPGTFDTSTVREALKAKLAELANDQIEELVPVHHDVRTGKPVDEIMSLAADAAADLIVIATHGRTGLKHVVLGSVAERVVREAPCPVLVVRQRPRRHA
jgi:nucleotide-binding universal stress UspA family protein